MVAFYRFELRLNLLLVWMISWVIYRYQSLTSLISLPVDESILSQHMVQKINSVH
jgi:hypothetical protein